jgi:hypothetical protein
MYIIFVICCNESFLYMGHIFFMLKGSLFWTDLLTIKGTKMTLPDK